MTTVLLDTHAWAWSLTGDARLSAKATALITEAASVFVSPISFFEIGQKVRIGKWPEMKPFVNDLPNLLVEQGGRIAALAPEICLKGATLEWEHRDPFDRLLAASALDLGAPLISADEVFDTLPAVKRLW
ncbi:MULTISPECIES: type II toxin-antitoxin system VapC family toxin [Sinorhizobium]|uniref:type II toxin-antitoxin system VapC family toxin n=1 Tax=Sinorhizobium TaxID=28105 RepID=UPI0003770610|nr:MULTISPECIES: type II toxin-antitoxin system VapC family toxin [Sinorhizobium]WOS67175.1 type II toxin-antitoxin system VapC family toxin [Sinorhizobium fredii GR64]